MLTLTSARDPRWNAQRTAIHLVVVFKEHQAHYSEMPFSASPDDPEAYGRALYQRAQAGEFGPVDEPAETDIRIEVGMRRNALMSDATQRIAALQLELDIHADAIALKLPQRKLPFNEQERRNELAGWRAYRVELAALEGQAGFPHHIQWPQAPGASAEANTPGL